MPNSSASNTAALQQQALQKQQRLHLFLHQQTSNWMHQLLGGASDDSASVLHQLAQQARLAIYGPTPVLATQRVSLTVDKHYVK